MTLTEDQKMAFRLFEAFIASDRRCLLVKGYAGTGKTFMIGKFVEMLRERNHQVCLLAPTGRAARVLTDKAKYPASTIHRAIYNLDELKEHDEEEARFKFYFELNKQSTDDLKKIFIVDEASLVSDRASEQEFLRFGSGKLLSDLVECIRLGDPTQPSKVVFVGDPAQLPPVNDSISPALDEAYLHNHFSLDTQVCELTQVVRQAGESAILEAATRIRVDIINKRQNKCVIEPVPGQIESITPAEASIRGSELGAENLLGRFVIVTYSNATALNYNQMMRSALFGCEPSDPPLPKDVLMVTQNNKRYGVYNGDMIQVESVDSNIETRRIPVGKEEVLLNFRNVITLIPIGNGYQRQKCKILENVLYNKLRDITPEEQKALYIDFCIRRRDLKPGKPGFTQAILDDEYFNALRVKFGYAITCHKAQGGEWEEVTVVFENNRTDLDTLRWTYTAITRAEKKLYGINLPRIQSWARVLPDFTPATEMPVTNSFEIPLVPQDSKVVETDGEAAFLSEFPDHPDFLRCKHRIAIEELKEKGIKVEAVEVKVHQYFVRYNLVKGDAKARIQVYFSKKRVFKAHAIPVEQQDDCLVADAIEILQRPVFQPPDTDDQTTEPFFPIDKPFLEEFYHQGLLPLLEPRGIKAIKVEHHNYRERYTFQDTTGVAVVDYVYNARGKFTHLDMISSQTTSVAMTEFFSSGGSVWQT